jgi:serine/threonine protein kinase
VPIIVAAKGLRDAARANQDSESKDQKSIWIEPDDMELNIQKIRNSSVQLSLGPDESMVLIDTMVCNPAANITKTTKEVRNLARVLAEVDPSTFGLLKCRGVMRVSKPGSVHQLLDFKFIFDVPHKLTKPQSLRAVLLSEKPYPLDERLELAKKLTASVLFVHTVQFVHKNIRPESIIIFQNECSEIGAPFLSGFEQFRLEDGATFLSGDDLWYHNLCNIRPSPKSLKTNVSPIDRHPSRQGTQPEIEYVMQHDIYSLGVVLLEIGLWTSFALEDFECDSNLPTPSNIFDTTKLDSLHPVSAAVEKKQRLEYLAAHELPPRLGRRYADIVLLCLRCLDPGDGMGDEKSSSVWTDQDGVVIGVRFIENVLTKMQEIRV